MLFFHLFESFLFFISMPDLHHSHLALSEKMSCNVVLCRVMSQSNVIVLNGEKLFLQSQKAIPGGGSPMREKGVPNPGNLDDERYIAILIMRNLASLAGYEVMSRIWLKDKRN